MDPIDARLDRLRHVGDPVVDDIVATHLAERPGDLRAIEAEFADVGCALSAADVKNVEPKELLRAHLTAHFGSVRRGPHPRGVNDNHGHDGPSLPRFRRPGFARRQCNGITAAGQ